MIDLKLMDVKKIAAEVLDLETRLESGGAPREGEWSVLVSELLRRLRPANNTRRYLRLPIRARAAIELATGEVLELHAAQLGNGGLGLIGHPEELQPGALVRVRNLHIGGVDFPQDIPCRVCWRSTSATGLQFISHPRYSEQFLPCYRQVWRGFLSALVVRGPSALAE